MNPQLELVRLQEHTTALCDEVTGLLAGSDTDIEPPTCAGTSILTIALVGPYNAGKSTIAKALTGIPSIEIGARPTTTSAASYQWRPGIRIVDTPGVGTGRADAAAHDEATEHAILEADQLLFVISSEGFDTDSATYFQQLLPQRRRTGSLLLVVNKISRTRATPEQLAADITRVIEPLTLDDVPTTFIDAASVLRANNSDDPDRRAELLERSRWTTFLAALDDMARRSGERSRAVQPLHGARSALEQFIVATSTSDPDTIADAALLRTAERTLRHCRQQASEECEAHIHTATQRVTALGDDLADRLEFGREFDTEAALRRADEEAGRIVTADLHRRLETTLQRWFARAHEDLDALTEQPLLTRIDPQRDSDPTLPTNANTPRRAGGTVRSLRSHLRDLSRFFTEQSAAGEAGHRIVYRTGKLLHIKFKPWGAVKATKALGKASKALGTVAAAVGIALEGLSEYQAHQQRQAIATARAEIRDVFATLAEAAAEDARSAVHQYLDAGFGTALEELAQLRTEQQHQLDAATALADQAVALRARIDDLLATAGP